jgi:hypothetical protein
VVVDALSHRSHVKQLVVDSMPFELSEVFDKLFLRIVANTEDMEMEVGFNLLQEIRKGQLGNEKIQEIKRNIKEEMSLGFLGDEEGVLWYKWRICVPSVKELKDKILCEAHESAYSIHLGGNKMNHDLKNTYWWYVMKRDIAKYVSKLRLNINDPLDCCSHYKCLSGSGKRLSCTLSWVCQELGRDMIQFG